MELTKKDELVKRLENNLRKTSRQLSKFDSEEETLKFLTDTFRAVRSCDFVGIILKDDDTFIPKVWSGALTNQFRTFLLLELINVILGY